MSNKQKFYTAEFRAEAIKTIESNNVLFEYIEIYYNRIRRLSANDWVNLEAFERNYLKSLEITTV